MKIIELKAFTFFVSAIPFLILFFSAMVFAQFQSNHPTVRELGIDVGIFLPGPKNSITDVSEVKVGHFTLWEGDDVRTGVSAILPHSENIFQQKVPAGIYVGDGFGKATGLSQIEELGSLETPILITNTLSVPTSASALIDYIINLEGNEKVTSVNPVVFETNDGYLNDIRGRHIKKEHVFKAIKNASGKEVEMGAVGAGTGTHCTGFKGGIGSSSRILPESFGGFTIGVLVVTNFGGILEINGAPVGRELGKFYFSEGFIEKDELLKEDQGSCIVVIATDAPLDSRNLKRLAKRAILGLAKTGFFSTSGSGDYSIAFSVHPKLRIKHAPQKISRKVELLYDEKLSPLFLAVVEATQEAVYNSLFKAKTVKGKDNHILEAIPIEKVKKICEKYNVLDWHKKILPYGRK